MSASNTPSGSTWLRWGLVALLILVGLVLAFVLGPGAEPVVELESAIR